MAMIVVRLLAWYAVLGAFPAGPIVNLTNYVERAGVFVFHADLEKIDVDGLTLRLPACPPSLF